MSSSSPYSCTILQVFWTHTIALYDVKPDIYVHFHWKYQHYGHCIWFALKLKQDGLHLWSFCGNFCPFWQILYGDWTPIVWKSDDSVTLKKTKNKQTCKQVWNNRSGFIFVWINLLNSVLTYYHLMIGIQIRCKCKYAPHLLQVKGPEPKALNIWLPDFTCFLCFQGAIS